MIPTASSRILPSILLLFLWLTLPLSAPAATVRAAVASNFTVTAEKVVSSFEAVSTHSVTLSSASTGKLYAQIRSGAPYDVLLAADRERPERLEQERLIVPGSRFTYAVGRLVLWSPDPSLVDNKGAVLATDRYERLAIANPDLAPYGRAAREALSELSLWDRLQGRLVRGENVGQALLFVDAGGADLGFVARAQWLKAGATGSSWLVPARLHSPMEQQAVALRESDAAAAFLAFLRGDTGRDIIARHGYDLP